MVSLSKKTKMYIQTSQKNSVHTKYLTFKTLENRSFNFSLFKVCDVAFMKIQSLFLLEQPLNSGINLTVVSIKNTNIFIVNFVKVNFRVK